MTEKKMEEKKGKGAEGRRKWEKEKK